MNDKQKARGHKARFKFLLAKKLDFPAEALFSVSVIEIRDFSEMRVSECTGISAYSDTEIVLNQKHKKIRVCGDGLRLRQISSDIIALEGAIKGINLLD